MIKLENPVTCPGCGEAQAELVRVGKPALPALYCYTCAEFMREPAGEVNRLSELAML